MVKLKIKSDHTGLMVPNKLTVEEFYNMIRPILAEAFNLAKESAKIDEIKKIESGSIITVRTPGRRAEEVYFRLALKLYELLYTDSEFQLVDGRPAAFLEASSVEKDIIVRMAAKEFTKLDSTKLKLIIRLIPKFKKEFNK